MRLLIRGGIYMKSTGFKAYGEELYLGDIVSYQSGYGGFYEVVEKDGEYWMVDCSEKVYGESVSEGELNEPFKLEHNLNIQWTKVDKHNPTKTPPFGIECECCNTIVGEFDVDTGEFTWFDNCASHEKMEDSEILAYCETCYPERETKIKPAPKLSEVEEYFWERYKKASFRVVPGHWPDFQSKEEVDTWIDENENNSSLFY